jgi:hypothetical protein
LLGSDLPFSHTSTTGQKTFTDNQETTTKYITAPVFALSMGFEILPVKGANPTIDANLSAVVPEPATAALLGVGMIGIAFGRPSPRSGKPRRALPQA